MLKHEAEIANRENKKFWYADLDELQVTENIGYKCEEEGAWWFPQLGWTLFEGKQVFADKKDALKVIIETCSFRIPRYVEALESGVDELLNFTESK